MRRLSLRGVFIHLYAINGYYNNHCYVIIIIIIIIMLCNYNDNGYCNNFTECHMYFVRFNEWMEIEFSWKKLILLPVNDFYNEWQHTFCLDVYSKHLCLLWNVFIHFCNR